MSEPVRSVNLPEPAPVCLAHRLRSLIQEVLTLSGSAAEVTCAQADARALLEWREHADHVVFACHAILAGLAAMRRFARSCPPPAPAPRADDEAWTEIEPLLRQLAALAPRLSDVAAGAARIHALFDAQLDYNLDLLFGRKRAPRFLAPVSDERAENPRPMRQGAD